IDIGATRKPNRIAIRANFLVNIFSPLNCGLSRVVGSRGGLRSAPLSSRRRQTKKRLLRTDGDQVTFTLRRRGRSSGAERRKLVEKSEHHLKTQEDFVKIIITELWMDFAEARPGVHVVGH